MTELHKIWIEQCEAAENIEDEFGTQQALDYLVGEKFLNFLEAAETDADFRSEISAFVAGIKTVFEQWQLAAYLLRRDLSRLGIRPRSGVWGDINADC